MATSLSLSRFFSFLLPSNPPPKTPPPSHLSLSSPQSHSLSQRSNHNKLTVPLAARQDDDDDGPLLSSSPATELSAVLNPALAYANTLFFNSGYNVQVVVDENESDERLLGRFRREVLKAGIIQESKRRMYRENAQEQKKRKSREASKRNKRRRNPISRPGFQNRDAAPTKQDDNEKRDDDNWDLPEGGLPN